MTYLIDFSYILKKYATYYPLQCILVIICILIFWIIKKSYQYENTSTNYKIENILISFLSVFIYTFVFFLLILYMRYLRWGYTVELLSLYEQWHNLFKTVPCLISIIFIEILLFGIVVLNQIRRFLIRELIKVHLYVYYSLYNKTIKDLVNTGTDFGSISMEQKYPLYNRVINKLGNYWSWENTMSRIAWKYVLKPYCEKYHLEIIPKWLHNSVKLILRYGVLFLLIIILLFDINHDYTLHYIFYYLPFYFIYSLWKNISKYLSHVDNALDFIIYERFYQEDNVIYCNTTIEEEQIIQEYIKRGFRAYFKDLSPIENPEEWEFMTTFPMMFKYQRRFILNNKTGIFENKNTGEAFNPKDIKVEKVYK